MYLWPLPLFAFQIYLINSDGVVFWGMCVGTYVYWGYQGQQTASIVIIIIIIDIVIQGLIKVDTHSGQGDTKGDMMVVCM